MIEINILDFIPQELRQQAQDTLVDFVSEQAKKFVSDGVADKLKQLRTDGAFRKQFDKGLDKALKRFAEEYYEKDEDLVDAIVQEKDLFKSPDVKQALMIMLKSPGSYLADEGDVVAQTFDSVLPGRKNRERVNKAMMYLLRCLVEELWHLPELQPIYSLQFQKITAEAMKQQVELQKVQLQALVGVNEGVRQALLQLTDAIGEKKLLTSGNDVQGMPKPNVLHNLPNPDYGKFVGRESEIAQIHKILRPYPHSQHSLVCIDGIGGVGKSTLAIEAAYYYLHNYQNIVKEDRFDAIIWVSAKQTILTAQGIQKRPQVFVTLEDIYVSIAVTLQRQDITKVGANEQTELVRNALAKQRTLLVIDNLETVDDERVLTFLRELPAPTKAIITTRHRVDVAWPIRLKGMAATEAKELIAQVCIHRACSLNALESQRLYDYTGGLPLAIVWSIAQIGFGHQVDIVLSRLGDAHGDIAEFCFEGSVQFIREKAKDKNGAEEEETIKLESIPSFRLLLALSLFATDASRDSLGRVANLSKFDCNDGLGELESLSLADRTGGRFTFLPITKLFAFEELKQRSELYDDMANRWIECMKDETKFLPSQNKRQVNHPEMQNALSAIDWCYQNGCQEDGIRLIRNIHKHLWNANIWIRLIDYLKMGVDMSEQINDDFHKAYFLGVLSDIKDFQNELDEAKEYSSISVEIFRKLNVPKYLAAGLYRLSSIHRQFREFQLAESLAEEGLQVAEAISDLHDRLLRIVSLRTRFAIIYIDEEKYEQSHAHLKIAREMSEQLPLEKYESWIPALMLRITGEVFILQGDYSSAVPYLEESLKIAEKVELPQAIAEVKLWFAEMYCRKLDKQNTLIYAQEAYSIFAMLGMKRLVNAANRILEKASLL